MPKNKGRGGKNYRRGKNENISKRNLEMKEEGQDYAHVIKMLGSGRLLCLCFGDGKQRLGHIRGKMKRKVWISSGDVVMVALREFQDEKCDIVLKYFPEEVKQLKNLKEIPENIQINENQEGNPEVNVQFEDASESDSESEEEDSGDERDDDNSEEEGSEEEEQQQQVKAPPPKQQPKPQPQQQKKQEKDKKLTKADIDDI